MKTDPTETTLAARMKAYEAVADHRLTRRIPVMGRMDGKAFHTLTRWLHKPFDGNFHACMRLTAKALCESIQGCKIAYVQSDEITILLTDYDTLTTDAWFDYRVNKMVGEAAAVASVAFGRAWGHRFEVATDATFDARFWNLPKEEVCNCFLWRQRDAEKNSVTGLAQQHFSDKELHGKVTAEKVEMLHLKEVEWSGLPTWQKRGVCCVRETYDKDGVPRSRWTFDEETPQFGQDRSYIDKLVFVG